MQNIKLGIDLGGTKIEAVLLAGDGTIKHRKRVATAADYDDVIARIVTLCEELETEAAVSSPLPVGIGTPGAVSFKTGLMKNCNSTCLNGRDLAADLAAASGRPVRIANDADCFALSEAIDGSAAQASNVFGVILGTGVGGGIVNNGRLLRGVNAIAGEWGHNPLPLAALVRKPASLAPRRCYCGRDDCIESWLSGPALATSYRMAGGDELSAAEVAHLASTGDALAQRVMHDYYHLLALALATVINILDPEVISLGGGVSNVAGLYEHVPPLWRHYVFSDQVDTRLVQAAHGDSGGVRGAAWLWNDPA